MNKPVISLVIPQYRRADLTRTLLTSLWEADSIEVIVVDDGSPAKSVRDLQSLHLPFSCSVLPSDRNRGPTHAWNRGVRHAQGKWIVLLNNDVVARGPWVERLIAPLHAGEAQISGAEWRDERFLPEVIIQRHSRCPLLAGWCLAFSRETFHSLGGLDDRLRLYFSDTDFQCRLIDRKGPSALAAVLDLPLKHLGHQTTREHSQRSQLWHQDRDRFLSLWQTSFTLHVTHSPLLPPPSTHP